MSENPEQITYFASTNARGKEVPFGIKRKDRERHMYVIGKTGMGKSSLLESMAIQDIRNGEGMAFLDPHGSSADRIMEYVPLHRIKDVVYFAPFDMENPVAFNVMEDVGYDKRHLVVSGLMSAFQKIWEDAWSARMEYILSNTLLALLEYEGATLLDVNRMLVGTFKKTGNDIKDSNAFRYKVVQNIKDPLVKNFWIDEFYGYTERYIQEATPAIQNKVGQFTSNPLIRNIIGQPKSSFDVRRLMDEKKILIINLSKGRVGEVNTNLLGSMLVTKIYLAAMSRADVPAEIMRKLPPFYLYVDEFQNFANKSFSDILSEARKYKLALIIAHQYVEQMEEEVRDAVFGNVGTTVSFRVGPFDAETLEPIFAPQFEATDLVNLGFRQIYLTLMIDGVGSPPFSATTLLRFDDPPEQHIAQTIAASRATYGKPRAEIERIIEEWQKLDPVTSEPPKPKYGKTAPKPPPHSEYRPPAPKYVPPPVAPAPAVPPAVVVSAAPVIKETESPMPPPEVLKETLLPPVLEKPKVASKPLSSAPRPPSPVQPPKPPLAGPTSLREALAKVTNATHKPIAPVAVPSADLKHTLTKLSPTTQAPAAPKKLVPPPPAPAQDTLSPETIRKMLDVDEPKNTQ